MGIDIILSLAQALVRLGSIDLDESMPCYYSIDTCREMILFSATGILTDNDLFSAQWALFRDPSFHADLNTLADYEGVTYWRVSGETLAALARGRRCNATTKTAAIVSGPSGYGMMRIYETWNERGSFEIFHNRRDALAWLNKGAAPEKVIQ